MSFKREEVIAILKESGLEENASAVNSIFKLYGNSVKEKDNQINNYAIKQEELQTKVNELSKYSDYDEIKTKHDELNAKLEIYKDYDDIKSKYEVQEKEILETRRYNFLKEQQISHPELFVNKIDWNKATYNKDNNTFDGLEDEVKTLQDKYKDILQKESFSNPNDFKRKSIPKQKNEELLEQMSKIFK